MSKMLAIPDEKVKSTLPLAERREPLAVIEQKLVAEKLHLESLYNQRMQELDEREDKLLQMEVHLFNQKLENYQKQTSSTMASDHFQEQLLGAYENIMRLKHKITKMESEKDRIVTEIQKQEYRQQQTICSKTKEINRLTADITEKVKDVNVQKIDITEKNSEIINCKNIILKLKAVQNDFVHFSHGEQERFTLREKIQSMKKQMSQQKDVTESALIEDLDVLESKLKSWQPPEVIFTTEDIDFNFKVAPSGTCKSSGSSSSNGREIVANTKQSYHRFLSKSTQTDCTLDKFWQICERENSVKDQLWWIREKKTALEREEARLLREKTRLEKKEKELNRLDSFLKSENAKSFR